VAELPPCAPPVVVVSVAVVAGARPCVSPAVGSGH
jgi:hypothetical protein